LLRAFDFETKNIYKVQIQAVSSRGDVLDKKFYDNSPDDKLPNGFPLF
jgi:hypothetical protein